MHAPANAWTFEVWVDAEGGIQSAMSSNGNELPSDDASTRFVAMLEDFLARPIRSVSEGRGAGAQGADPLATNCVAVHLGFDAENWWGPAYGPLGAPVELQLPLRELIRHALNALQY
jgi:hypothetical protein